jgi:hypothetical protein
VICHIGLETVPGHIVAAVENLGQYMQVWSSKSPWMMKILYVVKFLAIKNIMKVIIVKSTG